jgi:PhnB protein
MQVNPYLHFNGNCEEALKFYETALDATISVIMHVKGSPAEQHMPPEMADKVLHAQMTIDGEVVMASDAPPSHFKPMQGMSVCLQMDDPADGAKRFAAISAAGEVRMPFGPTFWSKGFGMCVDKFGVPWMINCPIE